MSYFIYTAVIKENALLLHDGRETGERRKYIYPEMNFSCNGTVTKWIYRAVDQNRSIVDLPELQI